jgi:hypothetical protein
MFVNVRDVREAPFLSVRHCLWGRQGRRAAFGVVAFRLRAHDFAAHWAAGVGKHEGIRRDALPRATARAGDLDFQVAVGSVRAFVVFNRRGGECFTRETFGFGLVSRVGLVKIVRLRTWRILTSIDFCERMNATTPLGWWQVGLEIFRWVGRVGTPMGTHLVGGRQGHGQSVQVADKTPRVRPPSLFPSFSETFFRLTPLRCVGCWCW